MEYIVYYTKKNMTRSHILHQVVAASSVDAAMGYVKTKTPDVTILSNMTRSENEALYA